MKNNRKVQKILTQKEYAKMWGEDGPYSQVRLSEEIRILDDSISRVFLVVEVEINPFTFERIEKNRQKFLEDEAVLQILNYAEDRGKFGYVVSAGEVELCDESSRRWARKQADMTTETLIRMHRFVIDEFGLEKSNDFGVFHDSISSGEKFIWNENKGGVEVVDEGLWSTETLIGSSSGVKDNKMRYFIVLAFEKKFTLKKVSASTFAKKLSTTSDRFGVDIEDVETFQEYMLMTALIPFIVAPGEFVESVLGESGETDKKLLFQKDYLITNVKKPTQEEIISFLQQLPLDKDIQL